jgi:hypothetical protein
MRSFRDPADELATGCLPRLWCATARLVQSQWLKQAEGVFWFAQLSVISQRRLDILLVCSFRATACELCHAICQVLVYFGKSNAAA